MTNKTTYLMVLSFVFSFLLSPLYAADTLVVTVDGRNVNLDWSAMPDAQSTTLYVALADYTGGVDVDTLAFADMGKTRTLYAPGLPSGLTIYTAIMAHTSQGDILSNIEKFMPFGGSVSYPESGEVLMQIDDPEGIGTISIVGARNADGSDASISKIMGNNTAGSFVLHLTDNKPTSYVNDNYTLDFIYNADGSVDFKLVQNNIQTRGAKFSYNGWGDVYDFELDSKIDCGKFSNADAYLVSEDVKDDIKLVYGYYLDISTEEDLKLIPVTDTVKTTKKILEVAILEAIKSELPSKVDHLTYLKKKVDFILEGLIWSRSSTEEIKKETTQEFLENYEKHCNTPEPASIKPTIIDPSSGEVITLDISCPVPTGAKYYEDVGVRYYEHYELNGYEVGPKYQWLKNSDGNYYLSIEFCRNLEGQKHGWFIQYQETGIIRIATLFNNGQKEHGYTFYPDSGALWYDTVYKDGKYISSVGYNEDGSLIQ